MKSTTIIWISILLIGSMLWGYGIFIILFGQNHHIAEILGFIIGIIGPVFTVTGIIAWIVYYFSKQRNLAMWVWTTLLLISMLIITLGHANEI